MLGSRAARAAAKLWYVKMLRDQQTIPVPRDVPVVLSGADDPDRVLLIGNGPANGWGTVTHELALTGQLARTLTRRTGRPTDLRHVGDETMNLAAAIPWLGDLALDGYDLVLVVLSMNDAVRLTPAEEYRADMERLLVKLTRESKPSARIVVAGIHAVETLPHYRGTLARIGQRSADQLNAATRETIGRFDGVEYMDLVAPTPEPGRPYGSPQLYADWSEVFAAVCAPAVDAARVLDSHRSIVREDDRRWTWQPAQHIIEDAPAAGWDGLERIVEDAKEHFGVDVAYVSLIDGDTQFYAANTGPTGRSVPLELTHCRVTFAGETPVVVENSFKDERFKHSPLIDLTQMRFYAGVPLQNEEGKNVGTFCVLSAIPGGGRGVEEEDLKAWASKAQDELQRLAADAPVDASADPEALHRA